MTADVERAGARIEEYARRRDQARAQHPEIDPRVWALAFKAGYDAGWDASQAEREQPHDR